MATINDIEAYFKARAEEIHTMSSTGTPWEFLCASAFIEYLSKLVVGQDKGGQGFKDFVENYLGEINDKYKTFTYISGCQDLKVQMYHILRCGIVHAFSFIPNSASSSRGGRLRSIVLCHKNSGNTHLSSYTSTKAPDAAVFVAEDFAEDIKNVVEYIFNEAKTDTTLADNIITWWGKQPPIVGDI